jgi:hypothetical protein
MRECEWIFPLSKKVGLGRPLVTAVPYHRPSSILLACLSQSRPSHCVGASRALTGSSRRALACRCAPVLTGQVRRSLRAAVNLTRLDWQRQLSSGFTSTRCGKADPRQKCWGKRHLNLCAKDICRTRVPRSFLQKISTSNLMHSIALPCQSRHFVAFTRAKRS